MTEKNMEEVATIVCVASFAVVLVSLAVAGIQALWGIDVRWSITAIIAVAPVLVVSSILAR